MAWVEVLSSAAGCPRGGCSEGGPLQQQQLATPTPWLTSSLSSQSSLIHDLLAFLTTGANSKLATTSGDTTTTTTTVPHVFDDERALQAAYASAVDYYYIKMQGTSGQMWMYSLTGPDYSR